MSRLSANWYFEVGEACRMWTPLCLVSQLIGILRLVKLAVCGHLCVSLPLCICSPNPRVLFSGGGAKCLRWASFDLIEDP